MRIGDIIESAIWITGEENPEIRKRYELDVCQAIAELCDTEGWLHGPIKFVEKRPGDDRVPPVPDHIQGPKVMLLVAEAEILNRKPEIRVDSFISNLEPRDLMRLRKLTRDAYAKDSSDAGKLTDVECDAIIEHCGPEAALATLRRTTVH